jgi:hypothetical protein
VAVALRAGTVRDSREVLGLLESVVPTDEEFRSAFLTRRINKLRLTQYLVQACEQELMGFQHPSIVTIEQDSTHSPLNILPRKAPAEEWPQFDDETLGPSAHRLGNVVIVPAELAKELPSSWEAKRAELRAVDRPLARAISEFGEWTPKAIASVQELLADAALRTWPR